MSKCKQVFGPWPRDVRTCMLIGPAGCELVCVGYCCAPDTQATAGPPTKPYAGRGERRRRTVSTADERLNETAEWVGRLARTLGAVVRRYRFIENSTCPVCGGVKPEHLDSCVFGAWLEYVKARAAKEKKQ